jgi:membrane-bound ClpP family serine protease
MLGRFVLPQVPKPGQGTGESLRLSGSEVFGGGKINVGDMGRSVSRLRPTGVAEINGLSVDVSTPGEWVDAGKKVVVVEAHGNDIVVEPIAD